MGILAGGACCWEQDEQNPGRDEAEEAAYVDLRIRLGDAVKKLRQEKELHRARSRLAGARARAESPRLKLPTSRFPWISLCALSSLSHRTGSNPVRCFDLFCLGLLAVLFAIH